MTVNLKIGDLCKLTIQKYDPTRDSEPYWVTHEVPYTKEMRVLEALDYIVEELGESLTYQWYCGVKKCGGCGIRVNGKPVLACWEAVQPEMTIEPLANLPVLRDLVIDRSRYERDMIRLKPWLERDEEYPGFPEFLTPTTMGHSIEMMHCIDCLICTSVCPAYSETSQFVGPAPLVQLARYALDPRDGGPRANLAVEIGELPDCVNCYECTQACPSKINVLEHAIDPIRQLVIEEGVGDIAHHNRVYRKLVIDQGVVSPSVLLVRSRGLKVLADFPLAFRLWLKGRLSIPKVLKGLLGGDRLETQGELVKLADAVKDKGNGKV